MKFTKSWLLIGILVGLLSKNVFSFPAHRTIDLANDLVSDEMDADEQSDDEDVKTDDSKRVEIAKEGSGAEAAKKTAVEEKDSPLTAKAEKGEEGAVDDEIGSGSATGGVEVSDDKTQQISKDEDAELNSKSDEHEADNEEEKAADEQSPASYENESEDEATAKKDDITESEDDDEHAVDKRTNVAHKRCGYGYGGQGGCGCCGDCHQCGHGGHEGCHHCNGHGEGCHQCHEHEGGSHEGECCGHEGGHGHGHHEEESCGHSHGHHHGFVHEWGNECEGEHHQHDCCGNHQHGHHHEGEHEHNCCHNNDHCCQHHEGGEYDHHPCAGGCDGHGGGGYGYGRSTVPVGYHCHDMVSKSGKEKSKRFCVPVYGFPHSRNVKKQTVHVGYGYASGDNYRLGYQQGGMGGLAQSFAGQLEADDGHEHNFHKRSTIVKRSYDSEPGYRSFNSGWMKPMYPEHPY